jgi:hypothetical protein
MKKIPSGWSCPLHETAANLNNIRSVNKSCEAVKKKVVKRTKIPRSLKGPCLEDRGWRIEGRGLKVENRRLRIRRREGDP